MQPVRVYHNPQCPRSREALEYLRQQGIQPEVVDYLANPLTVEELRRLVRMLGIAPSSLIAQPTSNDSAYAPRAITKSF